ACNLLRQQAIEAYRIAVTLLMNENNVKQEGLIAEYQAIAEFLSAFLQSTPEAKQATLDTCCQLAHTSLAVYQDHGDDLHYAKVCNDLLVYLFERLTMASDWDEKLNILDAGIEYAEKVVTLIGTTKIPREAIRSYTYACLLTWYASHVSEQEVERQSFEKQSLDYGQRALQISSDDIDHYDIALAYWAVGFSTLLSTGNVEIATKYTRETLTKGQQIRDNYIQGLAYYLLATITNMKNLKERDNEQKQAGHHQIITYAKDAIKFLLLVSHDRYLAETYWAYAESHSVLAREIDATPAEKRAIIEKAIELGNMGLDHAQRSGSADAMLTPLHAISKALQFAANVTSKRAEKQQLLEQALEHREAYNNSAQIVLPYMYWSRGVGINYEGLLEAELGRIAESTDQQIEHLKAAVSDLDQGLELCDKVIATRPLPAYIAAVAGYKDTYGDILQELFSLDGTRETATRAIAVYREAAQLFGKVDFPSRVAESHWKQARSQAQLGTHQQATRDFDRAASSYQEAAEKLPNVANFYHQYSCYMTAWSAIENAKYAHQNEEYAQAAEYYNASATELAESQQWSYLSQNFAAWALLEQAEHLSKCDQSAEAIDHFETASTRFTESKQILQTRISSIEQAEEQENARVIIAALDPRRDYCLARMLLEEARIDDREGQTILSATRYGLAADTFEHLIPQMPTEADRNEIQAITYLCRAWEKLKLGEANESPELCAEAGALFHEAQAYGRNRQNTVVLMGHQAFCHALEHGTQFQATKDYSYYYRTKEYLESASNYYLKAGYDSAAIWMNAMERRLDAIVFIDQAEAEVHPDRLTARVNLYTAAEKSLEQAAHLFAEANYVGKQAEVLRSLDQLREKQAFAISLSEVFQAPSITLSTKDIPVPTSTQELPVGLERFEHINIQAHLDCWIRELRVGETLEFEIDLINVGRYPAILVRFEHLIPQGFEFVDTVGTYRREDGIVNLRGRKLGPLSHDELRFALKATQKGTYALSPTVIFQDETGNQWSKTLDPVAITVKEFGILRWLRGPRG
ncbi:MAG: hypothetical protein JSV76_07180, partial [Candidatus Bathyarchaeota archaeon]